MYVCMYVCVVCHRQLEYRKGYHQYKILYSGSTNNFIHTQMLLLLLLLLLLLKLLLELLLELLLLLLLLYVFTMYLYGGAKRPPIPR